MGRWHYAVEGSRDEVVRYIRLVESEFQNPDERSPPPLQVRVRGARRPASAAAAAETAVAAAAAVCGL